MTRKDEIRERLEIVKRHANRLSYSSAHALIDIEYLMKELDGADETNQRLREGILDVARQDGEEYLTWQNEQLALGNDLGYEDWIAVKLSRVLQQPTEGSEE